MQVIQLLKKESTGLERDILLAATVCGLANAGLLAIINKASQMALREEATFQLLLFFVIAITAYIICYRYTFDKMILIFESAMNAIRIRITNKIRGSGLRDLERIGHEEIYSRLTQETAVISEQQWQITAALQSGTMVFFVSFYIFFLSKLAFFITVGMIAGGILIYLDRNKESRRYLDEANRVETEFLRRLRHLLDGFKQIKVHHRRGSEVLRDVAVVSEELKDARVKTFELFNKQTVFSIAFFYVLLGAIVFLIPRLIPTYSDVLMQLTASILFITSPLGAVVAAIPALQRANAAAGQVFSLEEKLDEHLDKQAAHPPKAFEIKDKLRLDKIYFQYGGSNRFSVGPIDLEIEKGELLFIIGGNGSGKSTLMKLLTGLYRADGGDIYIDDYRLNEDDLPAYREMFSLIFGDFHLFDKLYGMPEADLKQLEHYISALDLEEKVSFTDGRFTNLNLSTGQRKRLALAVALLEDRPVYVFDEWAADQDPENRKRFYEEILPELHRAGKTVIAVTHDDHYFSTAGRLLKLDYGKVHYIRVPDHSGEKE